MAGLKSFYVGLGAVAIVGTGALAMAMVRGGAALPSGPIDLAAIESARSFGGYALGDPDAPVELVEYADFECPACRMEWILTVHDVKQRLVSTGQVRFVFRDFPLNMHVNSRPAHHAAACADEQGKFWQMHDQMFGDQKNLADDGLRTIAARIEDLDTEAFDACLDSGKYAETVERDLEEGLRAGVSSTPAFFINGRYLSGAQPYETFAEIIDDELERSSSG